MTATGFTAYLPVNTVSQLRGLLGFLLLWVSVGQSAVYADSLSGSFPASDPAQITYLINGSAGQPYQYIEPVEEGSGIITDILSAVFEGSRFKLDPQAIPVKRVKRFIYGGKLNYWITYGFRSWTQTAPEGNQYLAEVDLFHCRYALIGYRDQQRAAGQSQSQSQPVSWYGKRVVVISGFQYSGVKKWLITLGAKIVGAQDQFHALELLQRGRGDFYLGNPDRVSYLWTKLGEPWQQFESFPVGEALPITIMMDNAFSDDFKRFVNERLATLQQSGVIDNILARYSVQ